MNQPLLGRQAVQALGIRLRDLRHDAGLAGRRLAAARDRESAKVSKIENGKQTPSQADVRDWCIACRRSSEIPDLIAVLRSLGAQYGEFQRPFVLLRFRQ